MQWYENHIAEQYRSETSVFDAEYAFDSYKQYRLEIWKIKWEKCNNCSKNKICEWPWVEYPELFWWDEFNPI